MSEAIKKVVEVELSGVPPLLRAVFNLISTAGAEHYALFGGAVRDADYAAQHNAPRDIKDYDLRVWISPEQENNFVRNLGKTVRHVPSDGTGRIRYCLDYCGAELDISVRPIPEIYKDKNIPPEAVARDRAADSDVGLCSIAIDPHSRAWGTLEYLSDRDKKTLTIYPLADIERKDAYSKRMGKKFPDHTIVELA